MSDVRISTIVPAWNAEKFIKPCIDSLLEQQGDFAHEIIAVNDGSEDRTLELLQEYGDRIVCIDRPNGGSSAARNSALAIAKGDYIALQDADDLATPDRLFRQLKAIESLHVGMVFGHMRQFRDETPDLFSDPIRAVLPGGMMIRKQAFERVGVFNEEVRYAEFIDWLGRARAQDVKEEVIEHVVLLRRIHGENKGTLHKDARGEYAHILRQILDQKRKAPELPEESA